MRDVAALGRSMSRPAIQRDLATVFDRAGMASLTAQVQAILAKGQVTEATLAPGTSIEWMALRRRGPNVVRNVRWAGSGPLEGFEFIIDDLKETYTFFVPEICGNVSLVRREPSRETARLAEVTRVETARAEAPRAEAARVEAARAEAARVEAARVEAARVEAARVEAARVEAARVEAARVEAARVEAARVEAARQADAARLAEERDLRVRPFIAGLVGKQHRQYDDTDPADVGRLTNPVLAYGDPLIGVKGGVAVKMTEHWTFAPAIGVAGNVEEAGRTSLFGDVELDYVFGRGAYLGTGLTMWDFTHGKVFTPGWLGTAGVPIWRNDVRKYQLLLIGEWRQMFDRMSDPDVNYQFWAGLKYLMK
ncbi:MAG: hypothetical protein EXQ53_13250 [Acidobacteria bacterium]|nr:hypothetical protein [Acidobacteriota bacterium]